MQERAVLKSELIQTLGFYVPGSIPVVKNTDDPDSHLTLTHELAHQDLLHNTVYGYTITRLLELTESGQRHQDEPEHWESRFNDLVDRALESIEGHAVALQALEIAMGNTTITLEEFGARLPPRYQSGLIHVWGCVGWTRKKWQARSSINACVEYTLDRAIFEAKTRPGTFETLLELFLRPARSPDMMLSGYAERIQTMGKLAEAMERIHQEAERDPVNQNPVQVSAIAMRGGIDHIKHELAKQDRFPPEGLRLTYDERMDFVAEVERNLRARFPTLSEEPPMGSRDAYSLKTPEPTWYLKEKEISEAAIRTTIEQELAKEDTESVVLQVIRSRESGADRFGFIMIHPMVFFRVNEDAGSYKTREYYYWATIANESILAELETPLRTNSNGVWLIEDLLGPTEDDPWEIQFARSCTLPAYVCTRLSGLGVLNAIATRTGPVRRVHVSNLSHAPGIAMVSLEHDDYTHILPSTSGWINNALQAINFPKSIPVEHTIELSGPHICAITVMTLMQWIMDKPFE